MKVIFSHSIEILTKKYRVLFCFLECGQSKTGTSILRQVLLSVNDFDAKKQTKKTHPILKPFWNLLTTREKDFPLHVHGRWRMTALTHHLIAGREMSTIQGFYTSALRTAPQPRPWQSELGVQNAWCHFLSNDILCPILRYKLALACTEPCLPLQTRYMGGGGFQASFREKQKEGSTLSRGWISIQIPDILKRRGDVKSKLASPSLKVALWTASKGGGEVSFQSEPPETMQTLFCDTPISSTKNSEPGPTEAVSGAQYFLWNKQHCSASANRARLPEGSSI